MDGLLHIGCMMVAFTDDFHIDWWSGRDGRYLISSYLFAYNSRTKFLFRCGWFALCVVDLDDGTFVVRSAVRVSTQNSYMFILRSQVIYMFSAIEEGRSPCRACFYGEFTYWGLVIMERGVLT